MIIFFISLPLKLINLYFILLLKICLQKFKWPSRLDKLNYQMFSVYELQMFFYTPLMLKYSLATQLGLIDFPPKGSCVALSVQRFLTGRTQGCVHRALTPSPTPGGQKLAYKLWVRDLSHHSGPILFPIWESRQQSPYWQLPLTARVSHLILI